MLIIVYNVKVKKDLMTIHLVPANSNFLITESIPIANPVLNPASIVKQILTIVPVNNIYNIYNILTIFVVFYFIIFLNLACIEGYYLSGNSCLKCDEKCLTCEESAGNCT